MARKAKSERCTYKGVYPGGESGDGIKTRELSNGREIVTASTRQRRQTRALREYTTRLLAVR